MEKWLQLENGWICLSNILGQFIQANIYRSFLQRGFKTISPFLKWERDYLSLAFSIGREGIFLTLSLSLSFSLQRRMFFRRIFRQNDQLDANQYRRLSRNLFPEWRGSDQTLRASSDWFQNDNRETRSLTKTIASSRYNISVCFVECALSC